MKVRSQYQFAIMALGSHRNTLSACSIVSGALILRGHEFAAERVLDYQLRVKMPNCMAAE
jgi:hypothetical protein